MGGGVEMLPKEYGYVVLVVALSGFLNFWMSAQVGGARRKYKVALPALYASESDNKDAKIFNCIQVFFIILPFIFVCCFVGMPSWIWNLEWMMVVQRGHQNSLEWLPQFLTFILLGGIRHPVIAALLGVVYIVSRYFYFNGYASGNPDNRLTLGYVTPFLFSFFFDSLSLR